MWQLVIPVAVLLVAAILQKGATVTDIVIVMITVVKTLIKYVQVYNIIYVVLYGIFNTHLATT